MKEILKEEIGKETEEMKKNVKIESINLKDRLAKALKRIMKKVLGKSVEENKAEDYDKLVDNFKVAQAYIDSYDREHQETEEMKKNVKIESINLKDRLVKALEKIMKVAVKLFESVFYRIKGLINSKKEKAIDEIKNDKNKDYRAEFVSKCLDYKHTIKENNIEVPKKAENALIKESKYIDIKRSLKPVNQLKTIDEGKNVDFIEIKKEKNKGYRSEFISKLQDCNAKTKKELLR